MKLSRRFKCEISLNEKDDWGQKFRCDVGMGGTVFWTKTNTLGELVRISFACKTFQGCDYKREELFKILTLQNPSIGEPTQHGAFRMCGYAELGERVCFGEANTLIFYKGKFLVHVNFNKFMEKHYQITCLPYHILHITINKTCLYHVVTRISSDNAQDEVWVLMLHQSCIHIAISITYARHLQMQGLHNVVPYRMTTVCIHSMWILPM